jgi:hypothetical protein
LTPAPPAYRFISEVTDMLKLFLEKDDPANEDILEEVESMAVAHDVVYADETGESVHTPTVRDGDETVTGKDNIMDYFEDLKDFLAEWQKFQSDACYCDAEGNVE